MFETAEVGRRVSKEEYRERLEALRVELINAQYDLRERGFSMLVLIAGDDRAGCEAVLDRLHEWLDARYLETEVFLDPSEEERERPLFWRYWRVLPRDGQIGIFLGAWTMQALAERVRGTIDDAGLERHAERIRRTEAALAEDGTLIQKLWIHTPQCAAPERACRAGKEPGGCGTIEESDWDVCGSYDALIPHAERLLRATDAAHAPWRVVPGTDERTRDLTAAEAISKALVARLAESVAPMAVQMPEFAAAAAPAHAVPRARTILDTVDLSAALAPAEYEARLADLQARLARLSVAARRARRSSVLVFEGFDAAGKGGAIRRLTRAMAAQDYRVIPIGAPSEEERARHYLWRFWTRLPRAGRMAIFDRSWYGRVLVERVEGLAREDEWRRAYGEIDDFEAQIVEHGTMLAKFWLHVGADEQLSRFRERAKTPYKKYKLSAEDFRNRDLREAYVLAVDEMVARTGDVAPWRLVPSNDKRWARIAVLEAVCDGLEGV